ncbi:MAG: family 2 glycosyl transferase [Planctomycetaceae bacterium]|nr:family 2 glycosyl transferase [Planctomycetaceae bacterium]
MNYGKAEAVRQGVLRARRSNADFVGYWDADLATPLEAVIQFRDVLDRRQNVELVVGTRQSLSGHDINRTWSRRLLGHCFAMVAATAVGVRVHDTQCGAKMFRCGRLLDTVFASPFQSRWIFDVEIFARVRSVLSSHTDASLHEAVYELPLDQWREQSGSKLKGSDYLRAITELSSMFAQYTLWQSSEWQVADDTAELEEEARALVIPFSPRVGTRRGDADDERRDAA